MKRLAFEAVVSAELILEAARRSSDIHRTGCGQVAVCSIVLWALICCWFFQMMILVLL